MLKITCKCPVCGYKRIYTEDDKIDEAGPHCDKCFGPMIAEKAERATVPTDEPQAKP